MKIKGILHLADGRKLTREVVYNKPYLRLEVGERMITFEPRHFEKVGKETILNLREYIPMKRGGQPRFNT
jgi:hypothetical protein